MDFGDCTICMTVPCANAVLRGRNGIGTPRQRGDCAVVSGLSFCPPPPRPPGMPAPARPPRPPATNGGILPSGGSMTIEVRLPVLKTELNTALYAPDTSCAEVAERALR